MNKCFYAAISIILYGNGFQEKKLALFDTQANLKIAKQYLPHNPVILDAGAFDGAETIEMKSFWPNCEIHAFEPVPEIFENLKKRTQNYKDIYCYKLALAEEDGVKEFFMSEEPSKPGIPSMSGSLLAPKEHLNYSSMLFNGKIRVQTMNLDSWCNLFDVKKIDFLWLDMQGYELQMIKAAPEILKTVKAIYTEVEFVEAYKGQPLWEDIKQWMEQNGFTLVAREFDYPPKFWFANALFIRTELIKQ